MTSGLCLLPETGFWAIVADLYGPLIQTEMLEQERESDSCWGFLDQTNRVAQVLSGWLFSPHCRETLEGVTCCSLLVSYLGLIEIQLLCLAVEKQLKRSHLATLGNWYGSSGFQQG